MYQTIFREGIGKIKRMLFEKKYEKLSQNLAINYSIYIHVTLETFINHEGGGLFSQISILLQKPYLVKVSTFLISYTKGK